MFWEVHWTVQKDCILSQRTFNFRPRQGRNRKIFLRGQSHFPDFLFFLGVKCFFFVQVENFNFGRPKTNFSRFEKWKGQKKKKVLSSFWNFSLLPFSIFTFPFTIFLLCFSISPLLHFSLASFLPGRSAEISRSEVSGGILPPCYATGPRTSLNFWPSTD